MAKTVVGPFWSLAQALGWICMRDQKCVDELGRCENPPDITSVEGWRVIQILDNPDKASSGKRATRQASDEFDEASKELIEKAELGELTGWREAGTDGESGLVKIKPVQWALVKIQDGETGLEVVRNGNRLRFTGLVFQADAIKALWPAAGSKPKASVGKPGRPNLRAADDAFLRKADAHAKRKGLSLDRAIKALAHEIDGKGSEESKTRRVKRRDLYEELSISFQ
ncbi:MAG: hypothetical protein MI920_09380 [Kiloniellales bacterium]|nr:hypothetical protein [Kiloniellales bacterium]